MPDEDALAAEIIEHMNAEIAEWSRKFHKHDWFWNPVLKYSNHFMVVVAIFITGMAVWEFTTGAWYLSLIDLVFLGLLAWTAGTRRRNARAMAAWHAQLTAALDDPDPS